MNTEQLQFPEAVHGVVDPAAGETAKADGMALAAANTTIEWADACAAAIELMARRGTVFQAADLIVEGLVDEPDSPARWGPAFLRASRAGVIEAAGVTQSKRATVHRSLCRAWQGTAEYRRDVA
ncbi:hypothetical protein OH540_21150 [Streptomyces sp. BPPL-273]|uniref:hypothetical protein n=1 Tax=Streptomyces sp. BPPL-273 TaxID=2987533 RepID=UPI0024AEA45B|nr:hypothetical protein [Streptomyces sp. BPPL-273]WHM32413.1 hypothetical protein OH540_21150 [Streptomyces sp. BPPL-273]